MLKKILILIFFMSLFACKQSSDTGFKGTKMAKQSSEISKISVNRFSPIIESEENQTVKYDFNTEEYDKIEENSFVSVIDNPLSTFSVDVDTSSYSNMRRYLNNNSLPPKDSVRIEEFVNYFNYNYPLPSNKPFSINAELNNCYWNKEHELLKIGIKGKELNTKNLPNSNIVFLIDVSGSMNESNKLPLLKSAFKILVNNLNKDDKVSIVVYAGAAGVVLKPTSGYDKNKIINSLNNLQAGGSTAGGEGINLAYKIAKENFIENGNNRVILATDGDFNIGKSSDAAIERLIESKRDEGIFLTVLGFGMRNYKDSKMEKLSNAGNGNYAYIDNILEAKKVLGKEFFGTIFTIAKDVKIQIEFNPEKVKGYRLIGYENRKLNKEDFNNDKKDAGEVGSGHTITAFYEIIPSNSNEKISDVDKLEYQKKSEVIKSDNYMTLKLRYKEPKDNISKLITRRYKKEDIFNISPSSDYEFASSVVEFGLLLRDSKFKGDANFKEVIKRAKKNKGSDNEGYRSEFIKLSEIAELIKK